MTGRFRELDGLRGLAALAVLVGHFTVTYNSHFKTDPPSSFNFQYGAFGVQLFFLISGFVILMSASRAKKPSDFLISRVTRIYPAYWLSLILALSLLLLSQARVGIREAALNFTMMQRWLQVPDVVDVYWTLGIELQFYAFIFVLLLVTRCRLSGRVISGVAILWLIVALIVAVWAGPYSRGVAPGDVVTPVKIALNLTLAEYGPLFCCGMFAYLSRRDGKPLLLMIVAGVVSVTVATLLHSWVYGAIVAGICTGFMVIVLRRRTLWLNLGPLQWLGKISYSLYIVHTTIGYAVIRFAWPFVGRDGAVVVALIASAATAWAVYELGEHRGSAILKNFLVTARGRIRRCSAGPSAIPGNEIS